MSAVLTAWALRTKLSPTPRLILITLCDASPASGRISMSLADLAASVGTSARTIVTHLDDLVEAGFLDRQKRRTSQGDQASLYRINAPRAVLMAARDEETAHGTVGAPRRQRPRHYSVESRSLEVPDNRDPCENFSQGGEDFAGGRGVKNLHTYRSIESLSERDSPIDLSERDSESSFNSSSSSETTPPGFRFGQIPENALFGNSDDQQPKSKAQRQREADAITEAEFAQFWALYPRRVARGQALTTFRKVRRSRQIPLEKILEGVKRMAAFHEQERTEKQFIPHASTWLNGEGWLDDLDLGRVKGSEPESGPGAGLDDFHGVM